jgi:molecular chaperone DnaK
VGITPAPRGIPQIEVTFDIDTDGIVHVTAKDKGTNKEQSMVVTGRNKLSEEEIKRMVDEGEKNKEKDEEKKKQIEMKNQADSLVYATEKLLKDSGDKIPSDIRGNLESLKNDLREAINNDNMARMKSLTEQLQEESMMTQSTPITKTWTTTKTKTKNN